MSDELRAGSAPDYARIARHIFDGVLTDMPAMGAASFLEDEIGRRGLQSVYSDVLYKIAYGEVSHNEANDTLDLWLVIRATPEQRARAFLEAMKGAGDD